MKAIKLKIIFIDGRKQDSKDFDFEVIPTITISSPNEKVDGFVCSLGTKWGYWAIAIVFMSKFKKNDNTTIN